MRPEMLKELEQERAKVILENFIIRFNREAYTQYVVGKEIDFIFETPKYALQSIWDYLNSYDWLGIYYPYYKRWEIHSKEQYRLDNPPPKEVKKFSIMDIFK